MTTIENDDAFWIACATRTQSIADGMKDPISRHIMTQVAESYRRLAEAMRQRKAAALALGEAITKGAAIVVEEGNAAATKREIT